MQKKPRVASIDRSIDPYHLELDSFDVVSNFRLLQIRARRTAHARGSALGQVVRVLEVEVAMTQHTPAGHGNRQARLTDVVCLK